MDFGISSDAWWESRVGETLDALPDFGHFAERDYGESVVSIFVVFMCLRKDLNLKRRVRFAKAEKTLYMDIMLDLDEMMAATPKIRQKILVERLLKEVPETLAKYKFPDFDFNRFVADLTSWIASTGWLDDSA